MIDPQDILKQLPPDKQAQAQLASQSVMKMFGQQMANKLPLRLKASTTLDELIDWTNDRLSKINIVAFVPIPNGMFALIYQQVDNG